MRAKRLILGLVSGAMSLVLVSCATGGSSASGDSAAPVMGTCVGATCDRCGGKHRKSKCRKHKKAAKKYQRMMTKEDCDKKGGTWEAP